MSALFNKYNIDFVLELICRDLPIILQNRYLPFTESEKLGFTQLATRLKGRCDLINVGRAFKLIELRKQFKGLRVYQPSCKRGRWITQSKIVIL